VKGVATLNMLLSGTFQGLPQGQSWNLGFLSLMEGVPSFLTQSALLGPWQSLDIPPQVKFEW
jgi:hypothetical protein